jgi:hypothetical protein
MISALAVGALEMYRVHGGLVTDYGADVFGTAWLYAMTRLGRTVFQRGRTVSPETAATVVFLLCAASEVGQRLHLVPGTYDSYDLLAYLLSVVACCFIDRRILPFVAPSRAELAEMTSAPRRIQQQSARLEKRS